MSRAASNRGRGGKLLSVSAKAGSGSPEHVRDLALIARARAIIKSRIGASRRAGISAGRNGEWLTILSGYAKGLRGRPWSEASETIRLMCCRILGLEDLPAVERVEVAAAVPERFRKPLAPPGRASR